MDDLMYMLSGQPVVIILLIILAIIFIIKGIQKVPDGRSRVVERLGRRHKILKPGLGFIVPFLDQVKKDGLNIFTFDLPQVNSLPINSFRSGSTTLIKPNE